MEHINKPKRPRLVKEALTLEKFKDGFSTIPMQYIATWGKDKYKLRSGTMSFRAYCDAVAIKVWNDDNQLGYVLNNWHHCFPRDYDIVKE